MKATPQAVLLVAMGAGSIGCSSSTDVPQVVSVELSGPIDTLTSLGQRIVLGAVALDASGTPVGKTLTWSSSDLTVATVIDSGVLTTRGNGSAAIIAGADGVADTLSVAVSQRLTSLTLEAADTVFNPGVRTRVVAVATDSVGSAYERTPLEWSTDAPAVVTVEPGFALPLSAGDATLTVSADALEAKHKITVALQIFPEVPQTLAESFQWVMEDSARANGVMGTAATVFVPGVGTWSGVFGRSSATEVIRPGMLFYPGSITKAINTAVLLSLVDDGILALTDTIGQWLSAFQNPNVPTGVSVHQLLQNTSGIYSFTSFPSLGDSLFAAPARVWTGRELMEKFVLSPEFAPGTGWKSSNSGYVLSALIAEAATGSTMAELLRFQVFDGMGINEGAAAPHFETPSALVAATWRGPAGGPLSSSADLQTTAAHTMFWPQSIVSSAGLATFGRALFGDFLSPALRAEMLSAVPDDGGIPNQVGAGIGIRKYDFLGRTQWGHSGSQGSGSGFLLWDEDSGVVIALLYNQSGGSHGSSHFSLLPLMLDIALGAMP